MEERSNCWRHERLHHAGFSLLCLCLEDLDTLMVDVRGGAKQA